MVKKIILDCDPGHDDAVAIMLAAASNDIEILGITMGVYLSLSLLISSVMNWYNKSIALKEK